MDVYKQRCIQSFSQISTAQAQREIITDLQHNTRQLVTKNRLLCTSLLSTLTEDYSKITDRQTEFTDIQGN